MKSDIELNHIWMEPTPLGKLWTILGLVPGGPKGLLGPIFDFWGSQGPKLAIFQRAIVAPPVEIFENFKKSSGFFDRKYFIDCISLNSIFLAK